MTSLRSRIDAVKALLFDKDGTILDYGRTWLPINREVALAAASCDVVLADSLLRACGQDPVTDRITPGSPFAVGGLDDLVAVLARTLGPTRTPPDLHARVAQIFATGGARHSVLLPKARETLIALKSQGYILGLATNDTEAGLAASLGSHQVLDLFAFHCGCDSGYGAKPEPGMVQVFSSAVQVPLNGIAVIGDSTHDLHMAAAAGAGLAIGVLCGTGQTEDLGPHADVLLGSIAELPNFLGNRTV